MNVELLEGYDGVVDMVKEEMEARGIDIHPAMMEYAARSLLQHHADQSMEKAMENIKQAIECGPDARWEGATQILHDLETVLGGEERMIERWVSEL